MTINIDEHWIILGVIALVFGVLKAIEMVFLRRRPSRSMMDPVPPENQAHIRVLSSYANTGDPKAQVELATRYMNGDGVVKNLEIADRWFARAAALGHPKGLIYLGYKDERAGEYDSAIEYFARAADAGDAEAMEHLGRLLLDVRQDAEQAAHYYKLAARAGRASAQRRYGECLLRGQGIKQDVAQGMVEINLAAERGDRAAKEILRIGADHFIKNAGNVFAAAPANAEDADAPLSFDLQKVSEYAAAGNMRTAPVLKRPPPAPVSAPPAWDSGDLEAPAKPKPVLVPQNEHLSFDAAMEKLDRLIGLETAKAAITSLVNRMQLHRLREQYHLPAAPVVAHMVFSGNPGTGKTTVARLVGNIFREIGMLSKGHVVEVARADLIGEYVGQTAPLVQQKVAEALDGILFVDEAYSLFDGDQKGGYGDEAVAALLKLMEDNRQRLVVIMAGYDDKMRDLLDSNPGLASRFSRIVPFEDFSGYELFQIFENFVRDYGYSFSIDTAETLSVLIQGKLADRDLYFGNARYMRQLFDETINCMANRIAALKNPGKSDLVRLHCDDLKQAYRNIQSLSAGS